MKLIYRLVTNSINEWGSIDQDISAVIEKSSTSSIF